MTGFRDLRGWVAIGACLVAAGCGGTRKTRSVPAQVPAVTPDQATSEYLRWLDLGRTPRRIVKLAHAWSADWNRVDPTIDSSRPARPGERIIFTDRDRSVLMVVVGKRSLASAGASMVVAHIDTPSPRLRARAIAGDGDLGRLHAYSYGGMRSHHWRGVPLALVGEVVGRGGARTEVEIGLNDGVRLHGEVSNGSLSAVTASARGGKPRDRIVAFVRQRYQLEEADLEASELYLVPAWPARLVGPDGDLIAAHGQDDRLNAYAAWRAIVDVGSRGAPERTAAVWLVDREEIGSTGPTGARSRFLELAYAWLLRTGNSSVDEAILSEALARTATLSADTPAALNPNFPEAHVAEIAPVIGRGPVLFPYFGRNGKERSHIAGAEIVHRARQTFAAAGVALQHAELGRVDEGGGGTVSQYLAERGMQVVDVGIPVMSMHSPLEISSTRDLWAGYRGFAAWLAGAPL